MMRRLSQAMMLPSTTTSSSSSKPQSEQPSSTTAVAVEPAGMNIGIRATFDESATLAAPPPPPSSSSISPRQLAARSAIVGRKSFSLLKRESSDNVDVNNGISLTLIERKIDPLRLRTIRLLSVKDQDELHPASQTWLCEYQGDLIVVKVYSKPSTIDSTSSTSSVMTIKRQIESEERGLRIGLERRMTLLPQWRGSFQTSSHLLLCHDREGSRTLADIAAAYSELLTPDNVKAIAKQIRSALNALHELGVVHRNLNPNNIVLSHSGDRIVLADLSLCRFLPPVRRSSSFSLPSPRASDLLFQGLHPPPKSPRPGESPRHHQQQQQQHALPIPASTSSSDAFFLSRKSPVHARWGQTSTRVGDVHFLAPEMIEGKPYGVEVDVWAFGVVLYYLCTAGTLPFDASDTSLVMDLILRNKVEFRVIEDNDAFEFLGRIFVSDPKRRLDIASSECAQHDFIRSGADFLQGFDDDRFIVRRKDEEEEKMAASLAVKNNNRLLLERIAVRGKDGGHVAATTGNSEDVDFEFFDRVDEDAILL